MSNQNISTSIFTTLQSIMEELSEEFEQELPWQPPTLTIFNVESETLGGADSVLESNSGLFSS